MKEGKKGRGDGKDEGGQEEKKGSERGKRKGRKKGVDKGKVMSIIGKLLEKRCHLQEEVHPSQKNKKDRQKWKPVFFYV
jgi:hypothetical protein